MFSRFFKGQKRKYEISFQLWNLRGKLSHFCIYPKIRIEQKRLQTTTKAGENICCARKWAKTVNNI